MKGADANTEAWLAYAEGSHPGTAATETFSASPLWGLRLAHFRKRAELTQARLATEVSRRLGTVVTQGQISNWERGRRGAPRAATFMALAESLNVKPEQLLKEVTL